MRADITLQLDHITPSSHPLTSSRSMGRGRNNWKDPCLMNPLCWYAPHASKHQSSTPPPPQHACVLSSLYACMHNRFPYVSPSVCPRCVAMLRCMNMECLTKCRVCFNYLSYMRTLQCNAM